MRGALVCLLALAAPAFAQEEDQVYDPRVLIACLHNSAPAQEHRCIGLGAAHCMTGEAGTSTLGVGICFGAEAQDWDTRLNSAYQALLIAQQEVAENNAAYNPNIPNSVEALRTMQRNWIAYRDAACEFEYLQWGGGTGGGPASAQCVMELTAEQTLRLERYLP